MIVEISKKYFVVCLDVRAHGKAAVPQQLAVKCTFLLWGQWGTRQTLCRVPEKQPMTKVLFANACMLWVLCRVWHKANTLSCGFGTHGKACDSHSACLPESLLKTSPDWDIPSFGIGNILWSGYRGTYLHGWWYHLYSSHHCKMWSYHPPHYIVSTR